MEIENGLEECFSSKDFDLVTLHGQLTQFFHRRVFLRTASGRNIICCYIKGLDFAACNRRLGKKMLLPAKN